LALEKKDRQKSVRGCNILGRVWGKRRGLKGGGLQDTQVKSKRVFSGKREMRNQSRKHPAGTNHERAPGKRNGRKDILEKFVQIYWLKKRIGLTGKENGFPQRGC